MTQKSQVVLAEALKLPSNERAEVAEQLIASLDEAPDTRRRAGLARRSAATAGTNRTGRSEHDSLGGSAETTATWQVNSPSSFIPMRSPS